MIRRILGIAPAWTIASLLLFTQIHAQNCFWTEADYLYWKIQSSPESTPLVIEESSSVVLGRESIDTGGVLASGRPLAAGSTVMSAGVLKSTTSFYPMNRKNMR